MSILASEAAKRRARQQDFENEEQRLFSQLVFSDKLKALAESSPSKKSPRSPMAFVNPVFSFFPTTSRRATVATTDATQPEAASSPVRHNASLDDLDSLSALETGRSKPKEKAKRVYVTRPPLGRHYSVEAPCVTIYSSDSPRASPARAPLSAGRSPDCLDGQKRVQSFPSLDFDAFEDELKYWRSVLHNSPKLKALEKR